MGDVEFPYWQPAVAPIILSHLSLLGDFIFIVYFPPASGSGYTARGKTIGPNPHVPVPVDFSYFQI